MANSTILKKADAIIAMMREDLFLDQLFHFPIKADDCARKPGKLPGDLISKSYNLEYGSIHFLSKKMLLTNLNLLQL